jgi:Rrf2 family iron-sulfur cluster assembly transcriptional regulator
MRFSQQVQYALSAIFDLAYNGLGDPVQVRVIGDRQDIPTRYLEQIFQRLRRAHLVTGRRGPGGGYVLARAVAQISVLDVIEAVEGPLGCRRSAREAPEDADAQVRGRPDFLTPLLVERVETLLAAISLEEVCRHAARAGVERIGFRGPDYQI